MITAFFDPYDPSEFDPDDPFDNDESPEPAPKDETEDN